MGISNSLKYDILDKKTVKKRGNNMINTKNENTKNELITLHYKPEGSKEKFPICIEKLYSIVNQYFDKF